MVQQTSEMAKCTCSTERARGGIAEKMSQYPAVQRRPEVAACALGVLSCFSYFRERC